MTGGVGPFNYQWEDGGSSQDRSGLGALTYKVRVTDANNCKDDAQAKLEQPEKATWGMTGNSSTDPALHFIGTSDAQDVVFKSNGTESLRLKQDGTIGLMGSTTGSGLLYRDADGALRIGGFSYPTLVNGPCAPWDMFPVWETRGNDFSILCPEATPVLGTLNNAHLRLITNGLERMVITNDGKVGIGTSPPTTSNYRLFVEDGIVCRDVLVKLGAWPDYVFEPTYTLMPLDELREFLKANHHLPGIPSAAEMNAIGGVEVGRMQTDLLKVVEEQALYILQMEERLERMEQRMIQLETSVH